MPWKALPEPPIDPKPPQRTSLGKIGRPIILKTNFFPVTIKNPNKDLVHYDIAIKEGDKGEVALPKKKRMRIFEAVKTTYPHVFKGFAVAFDQEKNAYSVDTIPQLAKAGGQIYPVEVDEESGRTTKFQVKITKVNQANVKELVQAIKVVQQGQRREMPSTIFQMLEVLFRHTPSTRFEKVGRCSFFPQHGEFGDSYDIGGGKQGVVGFFGSLRPAVWKDGSVLLNVDVVHTAFYKEQMVLDFLKETLNFRENDFYQPFEPQKRKRILRELKMLKIQVTHAPVQRTYKISDIGAVGCDRQTFPITDETTKKTTQCTVQNYFKQRYGINLRYPKLNCLKVGPVNRNIFIPIEFCKLIGGQKVLKKLSDRETATFIRTTAVPPKTRLQQIQNIVKANKFSTDPIMKALEFTIADAPMQIDGRVLPPPELLMKGKVQPNQGVWESRDQSFFEGANLKEWAVINYDSYIQKDNLMNFLGNLQRMGKERGMTIEWPTAIQNSRQQNPEREFVQLKEKHPNLQMIMVVLGKGGDLYGRVKRTGDREVCIVTQCVLGQNVQKNAPATVSNIVLKINAKMGGTNNVLSTQPIVFQKPVMVMGADVNHPRAGDISTPSLAAVVGSLDRFASKYAVEIRHQKHRVEMIQDLREMTRNLLLAFYEKTKRKPERIIMYRDGVSESQFLEVLSFELKAMRAACTSLGADYKPGITFIVVQKRHHTRLFCQEKDGIGKSRNIPPGTTVDTFITHPSEADFYLCSHQGIQGTSRPTHYHLLWDDNDLTMDHLQTMTYALCHLYSRCTRSVSIPTPAYYAHLAAFRAKVHIEDICNSDSSSVASGGEAAGPSDAELTRAVRFDKSQEIFKDMYKQMYYV